MLKIVQSMFIQIIDYTIQCNTTKTIQSQYYPLTLWFVTFLKYVIVWENNGVPKSQKAPSLT